AEDAAKHKKAIIELSKAMYVMTPFTSLLVLENEAMYEQYKVDRGRKDHWAMYPCPAKVPVVTEDEDGRPIDPKKGAKPSAKQVLETVVGRGSLSVLRSGEGEERLESKRPYSYASTPKRSSGIDEMEVYFGYTGGRATVLSASSRPYGI